MRKFTLYYTLFILLCFHTAKAQILPLGFLELDQHARSLQLLGKLDSNSSFLLRPTNYGAGFDKSMKRGTPITELWTGIDTMMPKSTRFYFDKGDGVVMLLPAMMKAKFNNHHPFGWNDEAMKAAKGLQTYFSTGVYAQYGPISIQLQPEWYQGGNPSFEHFGQYGAATEESYSKVLLGNSSAFLNIGATAIGVSTSAVWFGPGQFSSLVLSNNATNFPHTSFQSTRPALTFLGSFEWKLIAGKLNEDSAAGGLYENRHLKPAVLTDDTRYYNAVMVSFQPKFFKNLFIGASRAYQIYTRDFKNDQSGFIEKYLIVLNPGIKNGSIAGSNSNKGDQQLSVFTRWVFPKSHAEFYFEYGQNDHKANARDYALNVQAGAAYLAGFKKVFPLKQERFIELSGEMLQMSQSVDYLLRNTGNWYVHGQMAQGMTNDRQIMGAGSGFGNNVQTLRGSWVNGIQRMGVTLQRIQHDPVGLAGPGFFGHRLHNWNEMSYGVFGRYAYKRWIASLDMQLSFSKNYAWEGNVNRTNFYSMLNLAYIW